MTCDQVRKRWHVCHDDGHDDPEVDSHLASCDACQRYVHLMSQIVDTLDDLHEATESIEARPSFEPLSRPTRRARIYRHVLGRRLAAIAAVVAIAIAASLYYGTHPGSRTQPVDIQTESFSDKRIGISLRGESANRYLAVAVPKSQENVQMFWLYPSLRGANETDPTPSQKQEGGVGAPPASSHLPG